MPVHLHPTDTGNIAFNHCDDSNPQTIPPLLVTASVDRIHMDGDRPSLDSDMVLRGAVSWAGRSSLEINLTAQIEGHDAPWLQALFTFVARDRGTGKATPGAALCLACCLHVQRSAHARHGDGDGAPPSSSSVLESFLNVLGAVVRPTS